MVGSGRSGRSGREMGFLELSGEIQTYSSVDDGYMEQILHCDVEYGCELFELACSAQRSDHGTCTQVRETL